jgi:hypothetical protein
MKTLLKNEAGFKQTILSDNIDDRLVFRSEQDVAPVIEAVKQRREMAMDPDMKPVAEIPAVIVEQMMRDGSWNDPAAIRRWVNDPANECFRIWKGRV